MTAPERLTLQRLGRFCDVWIDRKDPRGALCPPVEYVRADVVAAYERALIDMGLNPASIAAEALKEKEGAQ